MNSELFAKFNDAVDVTALKKDLEESSVPTTRVEVPDGDYEVRLTKLELGASKKGEPQVKAWFKVLNGDYKGQLIFMNQNVTRGFQIHLVNEFIESLKSGEEIVFEDYVQWGYLLQAVFQAIDGRYDYHLVYGTNDKGFHTYDILEVFEN